jgi:hypothetical protein
MLGVLVRASRVDEFRRLEHENRRRVWHVRGVVSDHIPLCGDPRLALAQAPEHNLFVNNPPLSIYLHAGGINAVYYDLVADERGRLTYIEVTWVDRSDRCGIYCKDPSYVTSALACLCTL